MKLARGLLVMLLIMALAVSTGGCIFTPRPIVLYTASGRITDGSGVGLAGVSVLVDGIGVAETNANGEWSMADVDGTRTVTPTKLGWEFNPSSATVSYDRPEADFVGTVATYTISIGVQGDGTVERDPDQNEYTYLDTVTLTAVPADGWEFSHWSGDLSGTNPVVQISMEADIEATAYFLGSEEYALTIAKEGNGEVTVQVSSEKVDGKYRRGTVVTLTAVPAEGWEFGRWEGDLSGTNPVVQFSMEADINATAYFLEIPTYALTITKEGDGDVAVEASTEPIDGKYLRGTVVTLTPRPNPGWEFREWTGDLAGSDNPGTVQMDGDKAVHAVFARSYPAVYDDFSGDVLDESLWDQSMTYGGSIQLESGRARLETSTTSSSNVTLTSKLSLSGDNYEVMGELCLVEKGHGYVGYLAGSDYVRMYLGSGGGIVGQYRIGSSTSSQLFKVTGYDATVSHDLKIRREANTFRFYVDGVQVHQQVLDGFATDDVRFFVMAYASGAGPAVNTWAEISYSLFD